VAQLHERYDDDDDDDDKNEKGVLLPKFILIKNCKYFGHICCPSIPIAEFAVLRLLMMDSRSVRNM
jgi:hypothetical protein